MKETISIVIKLRFAVCEYLVTLMPLLLNYKNSKFVEMKKIFRPKGKENSSPIKHFIGRETTKNRIE